MQSLICEQFLYISKSLYSSAIKNPKSKNYEALLRTVVNRAYYASYWISKSHLEGVIQDNNIPNFGEAHTYIPKQFINTNEKAYNLVGSNLLRVFGWRKESDYHDYVDELESKTSLAIDLADQIFQTLNSKELLIKGLKDPIMENEIKGLFSNYGDVIEVNIIRGTTCKNVYCIELLTICCIIYYLTYNIT
jgi:hypothetical protein